jgi:hypothetical protein
MLSHKKTSHSVPNGAPCEVHFLNAREENVAILKHEHASNGVWSVCVPLYQFSNLFSNISSNTLGIRYNWSAEFIPQRKVLSAFSEINFALHL